MVLCQMLSMPQAISLALNGGRPIEEAERNIRKDMQMLRYSDTRRWSVPLTLLDEAQQMLGRWSD